MSVVLHELHPTLEIRSCQQFPGGSYSRSDVAGHTSFISPPYLAHSYARGGKQQHHPHLFAPSSSLWGGSASGTPLGSKSMTASVSDPNPLTRASHLTGSSALISAAGTTPKSSVPPSPAAATPAVQSSNAFAPAMRQQRDSQLKNDAGHDDDVSKSQGRVLECCSNTGEISHVTHRHN